MMKKMTYFPSALSAAAAALLILASGCAKTESAGSSAQDKAVLDAWVAKYHPEAVATSLGCYILQKTEGTGVSVKDSSYVRVEYYTTDMEGNYQKTTYRNILEQLGQFTPTTYSGPVIFNRGEEFTNLPVGLEEAISDMKVGGRKKVIVPGWLAGTTRRESPEEYVNNDSGTSLIYDIKVVEAFSNVTRWEKDSVKRYVLHNFPEAVQDTTLEGLWYMRTKAPASEEMFTADSTIYCDYTARRLDGIAFDTTIKNIAKDYGFYTSTTYARTAITWDPDFTKITMGGTESSVIKGFARAFQIMRPYESGTVIFISDYGYGSRGSTGSIPAFCPLRFDIQLYKSDKD